jgi:hypothetical protein
MKNLSHSAGYMIVIHNKPSIQEYVNLKSLLLQYIRRLISKKQATIWFPSLRCRPSIWQPKNGWREREREKSRKSS